MKEQSSTSNLPKNKLALEEKYKREEENLPKPTGWRLLVLPFKMKDKTKGGIVLAESTLEKQQVASQCGLIQQWVHSVIRTRNVILKVRGARREIG